MENELSQQDFRKRFLTKIDLNSTKLLKSYVEMPYSQNKKTEQKQNTVNDLKKKIYNLSCT